MIDPITEQILLEAKIIDSIKKIAPTAKNAILKGNVSAMKSIANRLPQKNFKEVEKEATRKLPNFRQRYKDMQRVMMRNIDAKGIEQPAALIGAIAATLSNSVTPDVVSMKLSEAAKDAQKLVFFPGDVMVLKLSLFVIAILLIWVTKGAVILPALQYLFVGTAFLLSLLGKLLKGAAAIIEAGREHGPDAVGNIKSTLDQIFANPPA
jgi:hypothetical protein